MRTFELRVYTLRTKELLGFYKETVYPRHLHSFPLFGVEAHGFWTAKADTAPRLFVLVTDAKGHDSGQITRRYMRGSAFADNIRDFDQGDMVHAEKTIPIPSTSSPLK